MAREIVEIIRSDISGEQGAKPTQFAIGGVTYEVDLTEKETEELRSFLEKYVQAGHKVGGRRQSGARVPRQNIKAIREWWRQQDATGTSGLPKYSDRGRIPQPVEEAFKANA